MPAKKTEKSLPVEIRPMRPADADEVRYVARRLPEWFHEGGVKHIARAVEDRDGVVAVYGGQIVGFIIYELRRPTVEILWMGVLPFYQKRGVGRAMVDWLVAEARAGGQGVETIEARTLAAHEQHPGYVGTRAFYETLGFALAAVEPGHFADGLDAAVYRRRI
jgi:ribosomal protein S18 acetylase RimI-like enzyme